MKKNRASVLIIAIMITLILTITLSGVIFITKQSISTTKNVEDDTVLFWAADAGANHGLRFLRRLEIVKFSDPTEAPGTEAAYNGSSSVNSFDLYDGDVRIKTELEYSTDTNEWKVISKANYKNSSKKCVITLSNIGGVSASKFGFGQIGDMAIGTRLANGDQIDCSMYAGGFLNIGLTDYYTSNWTQDTKIKGKVSFNKKLGPSYVAGADDEDDTNPLSALYANRFTNWLRTKYLSGDHLLNKGLRLDSYINQNAWACGESEFDSFFDLKLTNPNWGIFQKGTEQIDEINPETGVTYEWDELKVKTTGSTLDNLKILNLKDFAPNQVKSMFVEQSNKDRNIKITFKNNGTVEIKFKNGNSTKTETINLADYNSIVIPSFKSDITAENTHSAIEVEGIISKDCAIFTETNDIVITGDLYYKGLNPSADNNISNLSDPDKDFPEMAMFVGLNPNRDSEGNITDVNSRGNVLVDITSANPMLITAGIFCPNGVMGTYGIQKDLTYGCDYSGLSQVQNIVRFVGSTIMMKKGYWGWGERRMQAKLFNDPRWENGKHRPIGYRPAEGVDGGEKDVNIVTNGYNWKVSWE